MNTKDRAEKIEKCALFAVGCLSVVATSAFFVAVFLVILKLFNN